MSNAKKAKLLGMPLGTATHRLRKMLLFKFVRAAGAAICYRCGDWISSIDDFTVEHKEPWGSAKDSVGAFFDLDNVAFSHMKCNCGARRENAHCPEGHEYTEENTYQYPKGHRECRQCREKWQRSRLDKRHQVPVAISGKSGRCDRPDVGSIPTGYPNAR